MTVLQSPSCSPFQTPSTAPFPHPPTPMSPSVPSTITFPTQRDGLCLVGAAPPSLSTLHLHSGGCSRYAAIISQPPTSNLCISKPSVAHAQPTPQLGLPQLVITEHGSSETSHFYLFKKSRGGQCIDAKLQLAAIPVYCSSSQGQFTYG